MINYFKKFVGIIISAILLIVILYFSYQAKIHLQNTTNVGSETYNITEKSFNYLNVFTELLPLEVIEIILVLIAIVIGVIFYINKEKGGFHKG